jgi:hypothetical protein
MIKGQRNPYGFFHYKCKQRSQAGTTWKENLHSQNKITSINDRNFETITQITKELFKLIHNWGRKPESMKSYRKETERKKSNIRTSEVERHK